MDADAFKVFIILYGMSLFYHIFSTSHPREYYICQNLDNGSYLNPLRPYELDTLYLKAPQGYLDNYQCEIQNMSYNDAKAFQKAHRQ